MERDSPTLAPMQPDERALRTRACGRSEAFGKTRRVFLAARLATAEKKRHERRDGARHRPVEEEARGGRLCRHV